MKGYLLTFAILTLITNTIFGQHNKKGTYTGTHGNGKMVAFINDTDGVFIGYFYESRKIYHTLIGTSINNEVKGQIKLSGLKEFDCEGFFRNDSLMIFVNEIGVEHFMTIALKKISSKTAVNLDKYFSNTKPTNDPKLVGEWSLISDYDLKTKQFKTKKDYSSIIIGQNGSYEILGSNLKINSKMAMRWYVQDKDLIINIEGPSGSMEVNKGIYLLNSDTLTTSGERHIMKYVKKK